jgi:hypothetical protein
VTTPYVDIVDARIDPDSPGDFNLTTDIRNDLRHLYERANQVGVDTLEAIHDNFTGNNLDCALTPGAVDYPYTWDVSNGIAPVLDGTPDHWVHLETGGGAGYASIAASKYRMRFDLDRDHILYGEFRHRSQQNDNTEIWLFGFQDETKAVTAATAISNQDNIIGFVQDATAGKFKARTVKATAGVDVATGLGTALTWQVLRIEITISGATKKIEWFLDGTSVGSTTDTTKIPLVRMRPILGVTGGGGGRHTRIDYADFSWTARPLST